MKKRLTNDKSQISNLKSQLHCTLATLVGVALTIAVVLMFAAGGLLFANTARASVSASKLHGDFTIAPAPEVSPKIAPAQTYFYDFESGTNDWSLQSGVWSWASSPEGGHALRGAGHGFARLTAHSGDTSVLGFRFRLEDLDSTLHANVLENLDTAGTRYYVSFRSEGVIIHRQQGSTFQELGQGFVPIAPKLFHEAEIMVGNGSIDVFVDGEGAVGVDDPSPPSPGYVSFETLDEPVYVDDVEVHVGAETSPHPRAPRPPLNFPPGPDVGPFVNGVYTGSITLSGNTVITLTQGRYTVWQGDINLQDNARLHIEPDAVLVFERGSSPLIHWGISLLNSSRLEVDGGNLLAPPGTLLRIQAFGNSSIFVQNAKPWIHFIDAGGNATVSIANTRFVTAIGGSIQLSGQAFVEIANSKVGAIGLSIPAGSTFQATGLQPEIYSNFDLQNDLTVSGIGYNLVMNNAEVVTDTLGEGPFERGWVIFADETANTQIDGSTLRKLVLEMPASGSDITFSDLQLNQPTDVTLGGLKLQDVFVTGQWGFFIRGSRRVTFDNCDGLWFFLYDTTHVLMRNSTMNEFDPRQYTGTLAFENSEWKMAGEIIEGNDFLITGTAKFDDHDLRQSLSWSQSKVTRRFPITVLEATGNPVAGATITATRGISVVKATTGPTGEASVDLPFADQDYAQPWQLTTSQGGPPLDVDFFTSTPITVRKFSVYLPLVRRDSNYPVLFSDDFDDGTLTGWTPNFGTWSNPGTYMSGTYTLGNAWNIRSSTGSNVIYEGTVNLLSGNAVGLVFRSNGDGTSSYDVILDAVDDVFKISERSPYQVLASYPMTVTRNHPYRIKVVADGSTIEGYLDGVKRLTVTDTTYTSGHLGVMLFESTATYDDLQAWETP